MPPSLAFLLRISGTGAAYFITGRLALLMAIPPGYATAVWPAAGLALVCVLAFGYRVWPGVLIGSFFVNVGTAFDGSSLGAALFSAAVALGIAFGAALQATAGAYLVRRFVGYPSSLDRDKDIARFLAIAGPVSCLVSATWGVTTLLVASLIPATLYGVSWGTWFVGDTIGSVLFAPVALTFLGQPRETWARRRQTVAAPLALGFTMVTLLFVRASGWEKDRLDAEFAGRANGLAHALERRIGQYLEVGSSVASLYSAQPEVTRKAFGEFTRRALLAHPDIQAIEWVPRVRREQRSAYEAAAVGDGLSGFAIRERSSRGALVPAAERDEYFPVFYVEPRERNERAIGYDLASDAVRRETLRDATDSGAPRATPPITLVQEPGDQRGLLVLVPIYAPATPLESAGQRRAALMGFSASVFRMGTIVASALHGLDRRGITLRLSDVDAPIETRFLHGDALFAATGGGWSTTLHVAGRRWRAEFSPTVEFLARQRSWQAWFVLAGGLFFVGLLEAVLLIVTGREASALREATERRQQERDQRLLLELAERLRTSEDAGELLRWVSTRLREHVGVPRCFFSEIALHQDTMIVHAEDHAEDHPGTPFAAGAYPLSSFSPDTQRDLKEGRTVVNHDSRTDPRTAHLSRTAYEPHGFRACVCVPLMRDGLWTSCLTVTSAAPRVWHAREVTLLESVAEKTWFRVEQIRMVHALRELSRDLELRVADRTQELNLSLKEKEVLLKEIHHRVKNSLQVVSSLLNLQARQLPDPVAREMFSDSQWRVRSIARVHEKLYQSKDLARVDFEDYVCGLVEELMRGRSATPRGISASVAIEKLRLSVDVAVPCGLIINELVTNALKHAFPDGRAGTVRVSLRHVDADLLELLVEDDGVGLPLHLDPRRATSMGLELVFTFAHQLQAQVEVLRDSGTSFRFRFSGEIAHAPA